MNRQQAPRPVVSPLDEVDKFSDITSKLMSQPVMEDGYRHIVGAFDFNGDVECAIELVTTGENKFRISVLTCENPSEYASFCNTVNVENITPVLTLPCTASKMEVSLFEDKFYEFFTDEAQLINWTFDEVWIVNRVESVASELTFRYVR